MDIQKHKSSQERYKRHVNLAMVKFSRLNWNVKVCEMEVQQENTMQSKDNIQHLNWPAPFPE